MTQPTLFPGATNPMPVTAAVSPVERPRLRRQCYAVLERLRQGDACNHDLAAIALKYTGRLSECREAGYDIRIVARDHATGRVVYRLVEPKETA